MARRSRTSAITTEIIIKAAVGQALILQATASPAHNPVSMAVSQKPNTLRISLSWLVASRVQP